MEVLLHDDVAAAGECGILLADERGFDGLLPLGILRPIDEADEVAAVEVTEPMYLVHRGDGGSKPGRNLRRELEAQVHSTRSHVEKDVARSGDRMALPCLEFAKRSQLGGTRRSEESVPRSGAKRHHAGETPVQLTKSDRTHEGGHVSAARSDGAPILVAWNHRQDRKSTRLNSSHGYISYAVFCLKKKTSTLDNNAG